MLYFICVVADHIFCIIIILKQTFLVMIILFVYGFVLTRDVLQLGSAERFMKESEFLIHGNGPEKPPTGFMFEKQQLKGLYFNQSPSKVSFPLHVPSTST